jgi:hypothetical protein
VLRRDESGGLWAEMHGNLAGILRLDDGDALLAGVGAGSPTSTLATLPPEDRIVVNRYPWASHWPL